MATKKYYLANVFVDPFTVMDMITFYEYFNDLNRVHSFLEREILYILKMVSWV